MRLVIDASNIRDGGGITHLRELLSAAEPALYGFNEVVLWASSNTIAEMPMQSWLKCYHDPLLDKSLPYRLYWQLRKFPALLSKKKDLLFVPGGSFYGNFKPCIVMQSNLLPFCKNEIARAGINGFWARLLLLRWGQTRTIKKADAIIFLSNYAKTLTLQSKNVKVKHEVIPPGIHPVFFAEAARERQTAKRPTLDILYVSRVERYKNHDQVIKAVSLLRDKGHLVRLILAGSGRPKILDEFKRCVDRHDSKKEFIEYHGEISQEKIVSLYQRADLFVFASSCESFGQILLEAMASALPIACANISAMPEILQEAGIYFNPHDAFDIAAKLEFLINNPEQRQELGKQAKLLAQNYSWKRCAKDTFEFLQSTIKVG